jgi:raffinose/stachyose/melibiose transport system permease protein
MNIKKNLSGFIEKILSRLIIWIVLPIIICPIVFILITSLKQTDEFFVNIWGLPKHYYFLNYATAFISGRIGSAFLSSLIVTAISVFFQVLFSALSGYAFAKLKIPKADAIVMFVLATCMLPVEMIVIPEYIMASKLHIAGTYLGLILTYVGWGQAMSIFIFRSFFLSIPTEMLEAGRIDGAGEFHIFYGLVLPLVKPAVVTCTVLGFVSVWGELFWAIISLSNQSKLRTIPYTIIEFQGQFGTNWGPFTAAICIVMLPLIIFFLFTQKYFIAGLTSGAVKG